MALRDVFERHHDEGRQVHAAVLYDNPSRKKNLG
jgi:hypothetical protein